MTNQLLTCIKNLEVYKMSVDAEIVEVRQAIARVHQTIYGLTRGLQNITNDIDTKLDSFSTQVHGNLFSI
jgi:hypothetical protein